MINNDLGLASPDDMLFNGPENELCAAVKKLRNAKGVLMVVIDQEEVSTTSFVMPVSYLLGAPIALIEIAKTIHKMNEEAHEEAKKRIAQRKAQRD
jgi:hypothetical protein